jgi:alpha-mannosidase
VPQDRFSPRIDQGERIFRFWVKGGNKEERLESVSREAQYHNERPFALSFFPAAGGGAPESFLILRDEVIQMTACKKAEDGEGFVVRLFNPTDRKRRTILDIRPGSIQDKIEFGPYEVKTFGFSPKNGAIREWNLLEE